MYSIADSKRDNLLWWESCQLFQTIILEETEVKLPDCVLFISSERDSYSNSRVEKRTFYARKHSKGKARSIATNVELECSGYDTQEEAQKQIDLFLKDRA